jgi:2-polyprenyl-3-methyl-5-hydroxy-6-metoxy-1,4-benzoquinol methylase
MAAQHTDPFANFKAAQREAWASFLPVEVITTIPAAKLVKFAQVAAGQKVLDVACGAGVVAVTAARRGATVSGLDLSPVLLERARYNADLAGVSVAFTEGDAEAGCGARRDAPCSQARWPHCIFHLAAGAFYRADVQACERLLAAASGRH